MASSISNTDTEQESCSDVGEIYSSAPRKKTTVILDVPPPKIIAFGKITDESRRAQLERTPFTRYFQHRQRVWVDVKEEKEAILQAAKAEAQKLKQAVEEDDKALKTIDDRILELENEIKDLQNQVHMMERLQIDIPFMIDLSIKNLQTEPTYRFPTDKMLLKIIEEEMGTLDEPQKKTLRDIIRKIETMKRVKRQKNIMLRQRKQHSDSLNNAYFRMRIAREAHKELFGYVGHFVE